MKRLIFLTIFFAMAFATMAQTRLSMRIWKDGVASKYVLEEIDSVMFVEDVFIPDNVEVTNVDIIKRLSQLEKMVYGIKLDIEKDDN